MVQVNIKKLDPRATLPTYGTPGAAGADLYALLDAPLTVAPGETVFVHTGLSIELPEGYAGLVYPRSGLSCKRGLAPANKVGVIDPDYRGEVMVALHNHGTAPATVEVGERIAQLVVTPFLHVEFREAEELTDTQRGAGGFGSTGTTETLSGAAAGGDDMTAAATAPEATPATDKAPAPDVAALRADAIAYYHGMGAPFDRRAAVGKLRLAAEAGDALCRARLAYLSCIGDEIAGIPQDRDGGLRALAEVLDALNAEVEREEPDAMLLMGNLLVDGLAVEKDDHRAVELYYRASELGFAPAANALGQCYSFAVGVRLDAVRAVGCYRRAAEAGFAPAQFHLGVCYFDGNGIRPDKPEAAKWYAAAAEQGYAPAQFTLGRHYSQIMNGVENDLEKGVMWLSRAAGQGLVRAMTYLADLYHNAGTNEGDVLAAKWYETAATRGDLYGMKQYATYLASGRGGVPKEPAAAKAMLAAAARGGLKEAELLYRDLYGKLS